MFILADDLGWGELGCYGQQKIPTPHIDRLAACRRAPSSDAPGYFADWFPTLCDAAGLPTPEGMDGESLWPVMTGGPAPKTRRPMVWVFPGYRGQVAVRLGDFKVVRQGLRTKKPGEWEVYNLADDPGEASDLAAQHSEVVEEAIKVLRREMDENPVFPLVIPGSGHCAQRQL